jgi:membrane associated rhomboid family serine protease
MTLLDRLQRRFGRFAVPRVTEGLIACQVFVYSATYFQPQFVAKLQLVPSRVLQGEVWRLVTFLCEPPLSNRNPLWAFFFWWFFYLMGTVLEATWGTFRYNVYLLTGLLATVAASFLYPDAPVHIGFLEWSLFFAFAFLYPDFRILVLFIIPVKVKWLALVQWIAYGLILLNGSWPFRLYVGAAVCNFFLFFWHDIYLRMRSGRRRIAGQVAQIEAARRPRHACVICGANNITRPELSFRYCSKCVGSPCYCSDHIRDHAHVVEAKQVEAQQEA